MTYSVSRRGVTVGIVLAVSAALLSSCAAEAPGDLGPLQGILATCPKDQQINSKVITDVSGTSVSPEIIADRLDTIRDVVERTAVCGGHLDVSAFAANSVTAPILDVDLKMPGATDNAKLRQVPAAVDEVMTTIEANYQPAVEAAPEGGTDVTGLFRLLGEARDLRPDMRLEGHVLTDGLTNQGIVIDHALTAEEATSLADSVSVPELPAASVTIGGLGRVAGDPLPSAFIDGMKAFYTRLCANTGAADCLIVTDGR